MSGDATSVFDLSPAEKLQLVEDIWDDLATSPDEIPVHQWQIDELERRKANLQKHPASGLTWDEVKRQCDINNSTTLNDLFQQFHETRKP